MLSSLCPCGEVSAHPVPKDNHDRDIAVRLTPDAVLVDYLLEVDETRAVEDTPRDDLAGVTSKAEFYAAVLRVYAAALAGNLDATLDGKPLDFVCVRSSSTSTDSLRCRFHFKAPWRPAPGARHTFTFAEANYFGDEVSRLRLTLGAEGRVTLEKWAAPDAALMAKPALGRKPGDGERLRKASATFALAPEEPRATARLSVAPDVEAREPPGLRAGRVTAVRRPPAEAVAWDKPGPGPAAEDGAGEAAAADAGRAQTLLDLLLDTRQGIATLLLLAALFGAAHALTPGHGKTLVAAYLVGERGTVGHALVLGVVTTLTHTAAVLVLAALLPVYFADTPRATVQAGLGLVGGLLIAGLGLWLLLQRLAGRADHVHLGGGHHHHHGHDHSHDPAHGHSHDHVHTPPPAGWRGLVALGVQGGIVPCWDAIAMLGVAVTAGKLWLALPLLLAFSAGLAAVLVGLGVGVVSARNLAVARWGGWRRLAPLGRALPLVSAAVLTGMGLWLCYDSVPH